MILLKLSIWLIAFGVATFCFFVLFEHGFSFDAFVNGSKEEFGELLSLLGLSGSK